MNVEKILRNFKSNTSSLKSNTANVKIKPFFCIGNFVFIYISDFCCQVHVHDCLDVKIECIHVMNEFVDLILSKSVVGDELSKMSLM